MFVSITPNPNWVPDVFVGIPRADVVKCFTEVLFGFRQGKPFMKVVEDLVSATHKSCNASGSAVIMGIESRKSRGMEDRSSEAIGSWERALQ
ncbi:hypothetical protein SUGI_0014300 [Cryptomeria japonica]|nr:hypothetical protein SUGI_0014300 [Cryptomeria japonica]